MKNNFDLWMRSIDNSYLEEAMLEASNTRKHRALTLTVAACLVLAATGLLLRHSILQANNPDDSQKIAETVTLTPVPDFPQNNSITREYIVRNGETYTLLSCEVSNPTDISGQESANATPLVWCSGGLELKLCSTTDAIWASWYDTNTQTQWCLMSDTSTLALLTTAKELVEELGYNVAVAPDSATDITYDAFLINDLTVAETTFVSDGIRYSYRMAATSEVSSDFADISGTGELYEIQKTSNVGWCPAKIYYTENSCGKIIWFDIVPGLLYSLSMETNASEEALLSLAHELFQPAQDNADW